MNPEPVPQVSTPCNGTCVLGSAGLCLGCFRSAAEIARWGSMSEAERLQLMEELPQRLEDLLG